MGKQSILQKHIYKYTVGCFFFLFFFAVNTFNYVTDVVWGHSEGEIEREICLGLLLLVQHLSIYLVIYFIYLLTRM